MPRIVRVDNDGMIRACDQYGVIRADVLRRVAPLGSYHHADRIVVPEIALHGPFHQIPDWLYFRRDHPDRAEHARRRCGPGAPIWTRAGRTGYGIRPPACMPNTSGVSSQLSASAAVGRGTAGVLPST